MKTNKNTITENNWDKGFDAPKKDSTALRKCAKLPKKNQQKNCFQLCLSTTYFCSDSEQNPKKQKIEFRRT
jgi:hypothetical protein